MKFKKTDGSVVQYRYPERTTVNVARELVDRANELRPNGRTKQEWFDELLARGMKGLRRPAEKKPAAAKTPAPEKKKATSKGRRRVASEGGRTR